MYQLLAKIYFKTIASFIVWYYRGDNLLILDIDNTLAHTFESLIHSKGEGHKERLLSLGVREGTLAFIEDNFDHYNKVFLTARSYRYYFITHKWLKSNSISFNIFKLLMVPKASHKLWFLKLFNDCNNIVYIDDLSYNHENGEVLYYDEVINEVKQLNIDYYGFDSISKMKN